MDAAAERAALEAEELSLKRRRLKLEAAKLEQEEQEAASRRKASRTIVRLNVSGTQFDTHRDTLLMAGSGTYFALMLSDDYPHALDHEGRYFIDRDPRLFGLLLQFLRGSLQRSSLSAATCTELLAEADFFQCKRLEYWIHDEYDPSCLDPADQRMRDAAETELRALERNEAGASDFLIDVIAAPEQFACTRQLAPGTAEMPVLFAELRDSKGRAPGTPLSIQLVLPEEEQAAASAERRVHAVLRASKAAMRWATSNENMYASLSWEERLRRASEAHSLDAFRARFHLFAGPLLDGLDLTNLVVAGGSVLHALMLDGDPADPEVQLAARKGPADIDFFVVADDDASAHAAFDRLFTHLRTRLGAATAWSPGLVQAPPDDDGNAGAAGTADARPEGLVIRPWPDADVVADVVGMEERLHREDGTPPFGLGARELLVLRSSHAVTFAAGWPMRHVQIILRRYVSISQVLLYFDIDACQLAYDGRTVLATHAARRALATGVNVADATKRSASYEQRLHKYARRGFGVVVPGLDPTRVAERFSTGLFTRTGGGLRPVLVTLPEEREKEPEYEVGEPLLGLPKLVVLSALAQAEVAAAANDGDDAGSDEEGDEPLHVVAADMRLSSPSIGFSTTPGFAKSGATTATLRDSEAAEPEPVAATEMVGARLIDVDVLKKQSARRQRRLLSRMGELGHTSVTPRVAPRVREEDYDGVMLPYSARYCRTPELMRKRLRKRLKDKDNPMPPVVWDWVKVPQGWTLGSDTDEASLHTVLDAGPRNTSAEFWELLKNVLPQRLAFPPVEGLPFERLPWQGWFGELYREK